MSSASSVSERSRRHPGVAHDVGEADDERRADELVGRRSERPTGQGGEVPPPDVRVELLHDGQDRRREPQHVGLVGFVGPVRQLRRDVGVEQADLPLGEAGERLAGGPGGGGLQGRVDDPGADEVVDELQRLDVGVGEHDVVVGDVGEPERPPEPLVALAGDAAARFDLEAGVAPGVTQHEPFESLRQRSERRRPAQEAGQPLGDAIGARRGGRRRLVLGTSIHGDHLSTPRRPRDPTGPGPGPGGGRAVRSRLGTRYDVRKRSST